MALTITHAKVSTAGPSADPDKVGGDDWNDDHVLIGDYLRKATVTLSSADILDLHNTPVTLVAAPGAGKWLVVHRWGTFYKYGTAAYATDSASPAFVLGNVTYGNDNPWPGVAASSNRISSSVFELISNADDTDIVNQALTLVANGSIFTDGDGTLTVTVWYTVEDVPA